jgi:hypothetical protein
MFADTCNSEVGTRLRRVFLHLFAWAANGDEFLSNFDHLVGACDVRGIKPLVVLFDDDVRRCFSTLRPLGRPSRCLLAGLWVPVRRSMTDSLTRRVRRAAPRAGD